MEAVALGHELVCVANLHPKQQEEIDSMMYQTVGVEIVPLIAEALQVPIVRREIGGTPVNQDLYYKNEGNPDEVEDLFELLKSVK
jgi:diphthine-ammonia ligase